LHRSRVKIGQHLAGLTDITFPPVSLNPFLLPFSNLDFDASRLVELSQAITSADLLCTRRAAHQLAGLGAGLTPAGDDVLMGAIYAVWIIHPVDQAKLVAAAIACEAVPMTTSLSAAWIRAAAHGQAGIRWHDLFNALLLGNQLAIQSSVKRILSIGCTSGSDALAGFLGVLGLQEIKQASLTN
jgi:hypothetical protein